MASQYVLPSLVTDHNDLDAGQIFAQWRKRSSSTSQIQEASISAIPIVVPTRGASSSISTTFRSSSRSSQSSRPPSSFRHHTRDHGSISSNSPPPLPFTAPIVTRRQSSLSLDAKARANIKSSLSQKTLPSTPISATPSLTFSHSRADSRSDEDALVTPSRQYDHRQNVMDYSSSLDVIDRYHVDVEHTRLRNASSMGRIRKGNLSRSTEWKSSHQEVMHHEDDSFLPMVDDGLASDIIPSSGKKKTIAFQSRSQRHPDKVAHLLGEEYQEMQRSTLLGQLNNNKSAISLSSPSKHGFKSIISTMRGKPKTENVFLDTQESLWEKERRLEEKRVKEEKKKQEAQARVMMLVNEFSLERTDRNNKGSANHLRIDSLSKGKSREIPIQDFASARTQPEVPSSASSLYVSTPVVEPLATKSKSRRVLPHRHRPQQSNGSSTLVSSSGHGRLQQRNSAASIADGSFLKMTEDAGSDTHSRDSCNTSDHNREVSTTLRQIKKSHSIDALYALLQPSALQEEHDGFAYRNISTAHRLDRLDRLSSRQKEKQKSQDLHMSSEQSLAELTQRLQQQADEIDQACGLPSTNGHQKALINPTHRAVRGRQDQYQAANEKDSNVALLPALTSHLDSCLKANRKNCTDPWGNDKERCKLLSASSPRDAVPKGWSGYIRAYARGDFDLNHPPAPRSAPLVAKAIPRASPMIGSNPSMTSLKGSLTSTATPYPSSSYGSRSRLESKDSLLSLNSFYEAHTTVFSNTNTLQHSTPPLRQTLRDRLPSPRLPVRKSRSRDVVIKESLRLSRDDNDDDDDDDMIRLQAEELVAVGGMGDIRGPRPLWERERNASAHLYLDEDRGSTPQLQSIVERLAKETGFSHVSIQLLVGEDSIILASFGTDKDACTIDDSLSCTNFKDKVKIRDQSLDAHTILQRDGAPLFIPDLTQDWRFDQREGSMVQSYAGISLFAIDSGLPIGTVSMVDYCAKELSQGEREVLVDAARKIESDLEHIRRSILQSKLQQMDDSIFGWIASIQADSSKSTEANSPRTSLPSSLAIDSGLAKRRGARIPSPIQTSPRMSEAKSDATLSDQLSSSLDVIVAMLKIDFAYIARVGSDPLQCNLEIQRGSSDQNQIGRLDLDAATHLCALAALKHGLHFHNDVQKVQKLLGEEVSVAGSGVTTKFESAIVVGCGLKEGGKAHRGTEGWVLGVACRNYENLEGSESGIYLMEFATLLAPLLLRGPRSPQFLPSKVISPSHCPPMKSSISRSRSPPVTPNYESARSSPLPYSNMSLPRGNRKRLPIASPPPTIALPLPPLSNLRGSRLRNSSTSTKNEDVELIDSDHGHSRRHVNSKGIIRAPGTLLF